MKERNKCCEMKRTKNDFMNAFAAINNIENLFNDIEELYNQIPVEIQFEMNAYHNELHTLAHCIRWGSNAAEEIRKDWHTVVSNLEVDEG
jgi:hypothetical protein